MASCRRHLVSVKSGKEFAVYELPESEYASHLTIYDLANWLVQSREPLYTAPSLCEARGYMRGRGRALGSDCYRVSVVDEGRVYEHAARLH